MYEVVPALPYAHAQVQQEPGDREFPRLREVLPRGREHPEMCVLHLDPRRSQESPEEEVPPYGVLAHRGLLDQVT